LRRDPDNVYRQIMDLDDKLRGFAHPIVMGRSGFITHEEAERGIKFFGEEILPGLRAI